MMVQVKITSIKAIERGGVEPSALDECDAWADYAAGKWCYALAHHEMAYTISVNGTDTELTAELCDLHAKELRQIAPGALDCVLHGTGDISTP